jgi:SAM-dependent methyltransferase
MFTIDFLNELRAAEIETIVRHFPPGARVLEIGAGTGKQALEIRRRGFEVEAIEIASSNYQGEQLFPITSYDGTHIPFPDASFDVVFSSNVLEHVRDLPALQVEIRRVMRPGAICIHVLPTHAWRFWTSLAAFPNGVAQAIAVVSDRQRGGSLAARARRALVLTGTVLRHLFAPFFQGRHGEHGTIFGELWRFRPAFWRRHFRANGFDVVLDEPMGLHYTGYTLFGAGWPLEKRARLAKQLGSAAHLFELRPRRVPE